MEPILSLQVLGCPRLLHGGRRLEFRRRRSLALLCYLAVTRRPHARESLAALLAGESGETRARQHLRTALSEVRALVGDYVLVTRDSVALNPALPLRLDIEQFEATLAGGAAADPAPATAHYTDDFLAGFTLPGAPDFEDWAMAERARLRGLLMRALHSLLARHVACAATATGIEVANRMLALEPWCEEAHRALMVLLARSGQRSAALAQYETCRRSLYEQLGVEPASETTALFEQLRAETLAPPNNLPTTPSSCAGRERELELLAARLSDPGCRLVTIAGLGGVGKSHLARELAARMARSVTLSGEMRFADGVFWISLCGRAAPSDGDDAASLAIGEAIAQAVFPDTPMAVRAARALVAALQRKRMLLVLDSLEQVAGGRHFLSQLLEHAPHVTVLATSRVRLNLHGEAVLELNGLQVPAGEHEVETCPASRLLLEQAHLVRLDQPIGRADYSHIVEICRAVDGHPLALTIAARWLRALPCAEVARQLVTSLDFLSTNAPDITQRHRNVGSAFSWSWDDLPAGTRDVLRRLAVIEGAFDVATARAVAGADVEQLCRLRDASLLSQKHSARYCMHPLLRRYVLEHLAAAPQEAAKARERHAIYFARLLGQCATGATVGSDARAEVDAAWRDIECAWDWSTTHVDSDRLRQFLDGLMAWFEQTRQWNEGIACVARATARLDRAAAGSSVSARKLRALRGLMARAQRHLELRRREATSAPAGPAVLQNRSHAIGALPLPANVVLSGRQPSPLSELGALRVKIAPQRHKGHKESEASAGIPRCRGSPAAQRRMGGVDDSL